MFEYENLITDIPDYPKEGVLFKDITTLLRDSEGFCALVDVIAGHFAGRGITKVVGSEARGFMIGAPVAYALGAGFIPARKAGKLPRATFTEYYDLEYGSDSLEIHEDALDIDDVVLVADDLIATGGTAAATVQLVQRAGAEIAGMAFLLELVEFKPREILAKLTDAEFYSLIQVQ